MRFFTIVCLILLLGPSVFGQITNSNEQTSQAVRLSFNSPFPEYAPVLSWDGQLMYFAKDKAPDNLGLSNRTDIWYSRREPDFSWSPPVNVGRPLNDEGHSVPMSLSPLQNQLLIARERANQGFDYQYASAQGRMWKMPVPLEISWLRDGSFPISQIKSCQMSFDQQVFLFLAETPDGCGQLDIYVSIKSTNGQWGFPFNLGPGINSDENECSVFLAADNESLYFASNGRDGMGGYDLYLSRRQDDSWLQWSTPINLGPAVNTSADEQHPAMSVIGDEFFFSRKTKEGAEDIFSYILDNELRPNTRHIVHGKVLQAGTNWNAPLKVQSVPRVAPPVIQRAGDKYIAILPPKGAYLFYQPRPRGTFAESLPFFQKDFFDKPTAVHWYTLQQNKDYQERETHIQQLKNSRVQLLTNIQERKANFRQQLDELKLQLMHSLNQTEWRASQQEQLNLLKAKYQQLSDKGPAVVDTTSRQLTDKKQPTYEVVKKDDHFRKQKERLRRQLSSRVQNKEGQVEAPVLTEKGFSVIPFDRLLQDLYQEWLSDALLGNWNLLEEQYLENRLAGMNNQLDSRVSDHLSKYGLSEEIKKITADHLGEELPQHVLALPYPWQRDIQEEVVTLLQATFYEYLPSLLKAHVGKLLDEMILLSAQQRQEFLLDQDIQASISMQIAIEKKLPAVKEGEGAKLEPDSYNHASGPLVQEHDFEAFPLQEGRSIAFPGIVFEPNLPRISPESEPEVSRLVQFLQQHPELVVEIGVYSYGSMLHSSAQELCTRRADMLFNFIADRGVSPERLIRKGYGKKEIVAYKYPWRNNIVVIKIIE